MRNKQFEIKRNLAKAYSRKWKYASSTIDGIFLYHSYSTPKTHGWWDDVSFKVGSQVIVVAWQHPRMKFADLTSDEAYKIIGPSGGHHIIEKTPIYKKLGKNRKKVIATSFDYQPVDPTWFNRLREKTVEIRKETDIVVRPSIEIDQLDYCRFVSLVAPIEAVDEESVLDMGRIARRIIRGDTSLEELFGDYVYTKEDWIKDCPDDGGF